MHRVAPAATVPTKVVVPHREADLAVGRLMQVGDALWQASARRFARWNLHGTHYNVLRILNGAGMPLPQIEVGRRLLSSRANVTKVIRRLQARGLVARSPSPDRRVRLVAITPAGARFLAKTIKESVAYHERLLSALTSDEQRTLHRLLNKLPVRWPGGAT